MTLIENISDNLKQKPPYKKGGRPRKELSELRNYRVSFWLKYDEYEGLRQQAQEVNLNVNLFVREIIKSDKSIQLAEKRRLKESDLIFCKELIKIASNINQAVKALHSYKYNLEEIESVESIYDRLMNCIKTIQQ
jgi:hypothetical protein